ncbi:MAG: prepilin-type N-terminal cleavage/methylation domain-containing protein [Moritella sp.]|uniref:prepilin-type N-terminal cleavage/methylation domain-containing protein n=1 Tax=Moritella sp. TaxID=78556 RepID=UPI0029A10A97|nr:prepilin-type N-terminal cleavage/methylation domain-containing protein [Moritella sp.]MDX2321276.1 prepilin-type N-terminal cleavage/methylation domain-containing protein [Moritella sp.]
MQIGCKRKSQGVTLIGLLMALAILALLAGFSLPSYRAYMAKNKLLDLTRQLVEALNVTKQLAILRGRAHYFNINTDMSLNGNGNSSDLVIEPTKSCWVISYVEQCSCSISNPSCRSNYGRVTTLISGVSMTVNRPKLSFSPILGSTNGATYQLALDRYIIKVIVSTQGRIRVCMESGESASYASC